ncbi:hypothetical protein ACHAXA_000052 [Cyclostephanos tholiformis]|uniref:Uncharacterized protein n=1 Tax=Cyclostephanos tholiformis TaxID=382380 RepID=A0ABD3SRA9_9STRA
MNGTMDVRIKQEGESNDRIQTLEEETKSLKRDVVNFLSIITIQAEQLARQEKILNDIRDERNAIAGNRFRMLWLVLVVVVLLLMSAIYMGYSPNIHKDALLYLNVKATPVKVPFITAGVKVRFTMGDLMACVRGAFSGDTIDLSLS